MTKIFLKQLIIENLILVAKSSIIFEKGFTVISGETGSGKSSLLYALKLALGERSDPEKIREGAETGRITALFEVEGALPMLQKIGMEVDDTVLVTREISKNGKSRAFINHEPVQVQLLRQLGEHLMTTLDQGSSLLLKEEKEQLHFLDLAAKNLPLLKEIEGREEALSEEKKSFEKLFRLSKDKEREKTILEREKEEICQADLKPGDEELLFQEYRLLTTSEERRTLMAKCQGALHSAFNQLQPRSRDIEKLIDFDPALKDDLESFSTLLVQCHDLRSTLDRSLGSIEIDEERIQELNERLEAIEKLKKRYGQSIDEILLHLSQIEERLGALERLDEDLEVAKEKVDALQSEVDDLYQTLLERRRTTIPVFESEVEVLLEELNFPHVEFKVELEGRDRAIFYLAPNVGEKMVPVASGVSGGEMARLLLALMIMLSREEGRVVLLFDEMDAHIGGTTASMMGKKLKKLAEEHQVIAITHFPQVAEAADRHIAIGKRVEGERTVATISRLEGIDRILELQRMAGEPVLTI